MVISLDHFLLHTLQAISALLPCPSSSYVHVNTNGARAVRSAPFLYCPILLSPRILRFLELSRIIIVAPDTSKIENTYIWKVAFKHPSGAEEAFEGQQQGVEVVINHRT